MKILTLLAVLAALGLTACARNPATGNPMLTLATPAELREGGDANANATLLAEGLYRPGSPATVYVNTLCNRIYAVTEAAAESVQCNLIDDNLPNAFATPGYLMVNRGLLPFLNSEAELAAVLGHEAGHLNARHAAAGITRQKIAMALRGGTMAAVAGSEGSPANVMGMGNVLDEAGQIGLKTFSRGDETEADALGRRYMAKAGIDNRESVTSQRAILQLDAFLKKQGTAFGEENATLLQKLKTSHPPSAARVAAALAETGEPPILSPAEDAGRRRYMDAIEGLAYGPARRYGIARKHEIVLTRERLIVPLPAEAITDYLSSGDRNSLGTWLIGHPRTGVFARLTAYKVASGRNPGSFITGLMPPLLHEPVQRMEIGSNLPVSSTETQPEVTATDEDAADAQADAALEDTPAAAAQVIGYTSTYHYLNSSKRFRLVAFGAPTRRDRMILLTAIYPDAKTMEQEDQNVMSILKNVKFLTRTQALKYKPLELQTFIAANETVAMHAEKIPVGALREDLFRALNHLPEGTEMTPGQRYKTIIDPN